MATQTYHYRAYDWRTGSSLSTSRTIETDTTRTLSRHLVPAGTLIAVPADDPLLDGLRSLGFERVSRQQADRSGLMRNDPDDRGADWQRDWNEPRLDDLRARLVDAWE